MVAPWAPDTPASWEPASVLRPSLTIPHAVPGLLVWSPFSALGAPARPLGCLTDAVREGSLGHRVVTQRGTRDGCPGRREVPGLCLV